MKKAVLMEKKPKKTEGLRKAKKIGEKMSIAEKLEKIKKIRKLELAKRDLKE